MNYYVGIDLGGTNTKIGLVDEAGNIIFTTIVKTDSMEGFEKTVERLSKILLEQRSRNRSARTCSKRKNSKILG